MGRPDGWTNGPGAQEAQCPSAVVTLVGDTPEDLAMGAAPSRPVIVGHIDEPERGAVIDGEGLRVRGWAYGIGSPLSRVDVFLSDHCLGPAGLARPRADVAEALGEPDAELSGFELLVGAASVPEAGDQSVRVVVTLVDGTHESLGPLAVQIAPPPDGRPPAVVDQRRGVAHYRTARRRSDDVIRVLWSARSLDQGGSQLRMAELVEHLSSDGRFHSTVLSPVEGPLRKVLEASGATVHVGLAVPFDNAAVYERSVSELRQWMDGRFDLVVGFTVTSFPAVDVAIRTGLPSVLRIGEAEPLRTVVAWLFGTLHPAVERQARSTLAGASAVLSNSNAAVAKYRADGYTGNFVVLGTGVDVEGARAYRQSSDRQECRRRLGIRTDERFVLCAGTVWSVKGQALLVMALDRLHRDQPNLTCALLGNADDRYADAISSFIRRNGLTDAVRVLPFQDDLRPWWRAADLAVCPSESEALPAAVLEAMAYGLPALTCKVGDLADLVEPGVTGWLCEHSDLKALTAALNAAATASPAELGRMGTAAAHRVRRSFDRREVLDRSTELLSSVADGGRATS